MPKTAAPDWAAIRHRYVETDAAVAAIANDAGISQSDLDNARKREGWKRQKPRGRPPGRRPAAPKPKQKQKPAIKPEKRAAVAIEPEAKPALAKTKRKPARTTATPSGRRRLIDRLVAAISLKLEQLERRMAQDLAQQDLAQHDLADDGANTPASRDTASSTDHERETRAIGALIDNLGKVTEMETGLDRSAPRGKSTAAADISGEADRYRRELAERLAKIVGAATARP